MSGSRLNQSELDSSREFIARHIGASEVEQQDMLQAIGVDSFDALLDRTVPASIRMTESMELEEPVGEAATLAKLRDHAARTKVSRSVIGMGYYPSLTPAVIQRNILEAPAWYTAYTPYQPEVSQGRLEALLNFQTMISDLTAMEIANASLLDEATAAAEAVTLCRKAARAQGDVLFVSRQCHPQTIDVLQTRAEPVGIRVVVGDEAEGVCEEAFAAVVQYPDTNGEIRDYAGLADSLHARGAMLVVAADLLALTLITPPENGGRTSSSAPASVSAYRSVSAARMPPSSQPGRVQARDARTPGRCFARQRRQAGLSTGVADARTAYPAGEGNQQHLHFPGPAGGYGVDVRRLPRTAGSAADRKAGSSHDGHPGTGPARSRIRSRDVGFLRHDNRED